MSTTEYLLHNSSYNKHHSVPKHLVSCSVTFRWIVACASLYLQLGVKPFRRGLFMTLRKVGCILWCIERWVSWNIRVWWSQLRGEASEQEDVRESEICSETCGGFSSLPPPSCCRNTFKTHPRRNERYISLSAPKPITKRNNNPHESHESWKMDTSFSEC